MPDPYDIGNGPALQPASVGLDEFVRPRESNSGKQLNELAQTLSSVRPELNNFLQPMAEQADANESAQGQRWALKNLSVSAGDFQTQTAGWSVPRILAASQSLAQHSADDYSMELNQSLVNLAKSGKPASPDQINQTIQPLRDKYLQDGQPYGSLWTKTFSEYAQQYETGAMHNYQSQVLDEQGRQAVSNATSDVAAESTAILTQPGDYQANFSHWLQSYFDPSHLHSPLSPTQKNQAIIGGFQGAVIHALSSQKFDIADHLLDGFKNIEVFPGAKISNTEQGTQALQDMMRQSTFAREGANRTDGQQDRQDQINVRLAIQQRISDQQKLPPSTRSLQLPDDLLIQGIKAGLTSEGMQSSYEYGLKSPLREGKEESQGDIQDITAKSAKAWNDYWMNRNTEGFHSLQQSLTDLTKLPQAQGAQAQEILRPRLEEMAKEYQSRYSDGAQDSSPVVSNAVRTFNRDISLQSGELDKTLRGVDQSLLPKVLQNLPGVQLDPNDPKNERYAAVGITANAQDELTSKLHDLGPDAWGDQKQVNAVKDEVFNKYKEQIQNLTKQAQSAVDDGTKDTPAAPSNLIGPSGTPNQSFVSQVMNSRSSADDVLSQGPSKYAAGAFAGPLTLIKSAMDSNGNYGANSVTRPFKESIYTPDDLRDPAMHGRSEAIDNFQDRWDSTTSALQQFEKDNGPLLKDAASKSLSDYSGNQRASLVQWAKMRTQWNAMVNVRGLNSDELAKTPPEWLVTPTAPVPAVPIGNLDLADDKALDSIQKQFNLSATQRHDFVATQLELQRLQELDVNRKSTSARYGGAGLSAVPFFRPSEPRGIQRPANPNLDKLTEQFGSIPAGK